ncbi:MAG: biopolymer transporter ExbD [Planctomycetes bacterium]|nr:biopolymer transporter ExbD [Planctomycetota bacterium]
MHKRKVATVQDPQSPNLIPMIDIMFRLLLFFLLGADMAARETATMVLADADKSKEIDPNRDETEPETTINIHHEVAGDGACPIYDNGGVCRVKEHWLWSISGKSYTKETIGEKLKELAELSPEDHVDPDAKKVLSRRKVMIRADKSAPYGDVQKVIEMCGTATLYKVAVVGALPMPEK